MTRHAISPRLAIRIFLSMVTGPSPCAEYAEGVAAASVGRSPETRGAIATRQNAP